MAHWYVVGVQGGFDTFGREHYRSAIDIYTSMGGRGTIVAVYMDAFVSLAGEKLIYDSSSHARSILALWCDHVTVERYDPDP
jgi:hypothetical protein